MAHEPFWYLATPYSGFSKGIDVAFGEAARVAATLIKRGIRVYSPIAHTHPIAQYGKLDPLDHAIWLPADNPFMEAAVGLIVVKMPGWEESRGLRAEIKKFRANNKPVLYMEYVEDD